MERYLEDFQVGQTYHSGRVKSAVDQIKRFAAEFDVAASTLPTVAPDNPEFLEVDVNRVLPAAGNVPEDPPLRRIALDGETESRAVHQLVVDRPLAVRAIEPERARQPDPIGRIRAGIARQPRQTDGREHAIVRAARRVRERPSRTSANQQPVDQLLEGECYRVQGCVRAARVSYMRLTTAKKNPVDHPHIRIPVRASTPPTIRHSSGNTTSP
jgi:hypothetical protein